MFFLSGRETPRCNKNASRTRKAKKKLYNIYSRNTVSHLRPCVILIAKERIEERWPSVGEVKERVTECTIVWTQMGEDAFCFHFFLIFFGVVE